MNSKLFLNEIHESLAVDKMSLFDTIRALQEKHKLDVDEITTILKSERTLLHDLRAECLERGMLKNINFSKDIEGLF
jgi:hypothetical protein